MSGSITWKEHIAEQCRNPAFAKHWAEAQPGIHLAVNVWRLREALGWTQQQLAQRAGIRQPRIAEIARTDANPTLLTITRIALALGVTPARLLEEARPLHHAEEGGEGDPGDEASAQPSPMGPKTGIPSPPSAGPRKARGRTRT